MSPNLMLIPSMACPAHCKYCFGPHEGGQTMTRETLEAVIRWQNSLDSEGSLEITFHGGEPLVPGIDFYRTALPLLQENLSSRKVRFGIQSNLWLLTDELCDLFQEHDVSLGTSLDGPQEINDAQRGDGYFQRTMDSIQLSRSHGLSPGCICTFTPKSAERAEEIFDFFLREGLGFSIHAALPPLGHPGHGWALSPENHGTLLTGILDRYMDNADKIRISTLDSLIQSVSAREGGTCTFGDCLGEFFAVDPQGWIYPCQRFAGHPPYRLGNVHDQPSMEELSASPFWQMLEDREEHIAEECADCPYLDICRGGCPYNVLAANSGGFENALRDPHCPAYKCILDEITDRALEEVFSKENMDAVVEKGAGEYGLMQKGALLQIMRGGPHPQKVARRAREVVGAAALGSSPSPEEAVRKLDRAGVITRSNRALGSLTALQNRLNTQSQDGLVNAYLHVTYRCNLACTHCYARSGPGAFPSMAVEDIAGLVQQAAEAGFRKAVLTGGEPMNHPQRLQLLDAMEALREKVKPLQTVLRTNLAYPLSPTLVEKIAQSTDQIVVSVDGNQENHDARRGKGTYKRTLENLRTLQEAGPDAEIRITAVLTAAQQEGPAGAAVRSLGEELGLSTRVKSLLPLGRGLEMNPTPNYYRSLGEDDADRLAYGARPASTCGLGMNLYIGPEGSCYPCYTLMGESHHLGNALEEGLPAVLKRNDAYRQVTVDSNTRCSQCDLRYVCGGFCRAWSSTEDPDSPPLACRALYTRAQRQLASALDVLSIERGSWEAAGLPSPEMDFLETF